MNLIDVTTEAPNGLPDRINSTKRLIVVADRDAAALPPRTAP